MVYNFSDEMEQKMCIDQTGCFPVQSYKRIQYVIVLYEISSNVILAKQLRNKTSEEMVAAYQNLIDRLREGGI